MVNNFSATQDDVEMLPSVTPSRHFWWGFLISVIVTVLTFLVIALIDAKGDAIDRLGETVILLLAGFFTSIPYSALWSFTNTRFTLLGMKFNKTTRTISICSSFFTMLVALVVAFLFAFSFGPVPGQKLFSQFFTNPIFLAFCILSVINFFAFLVFNFHFLKPNEEHHEKH